MPLDLQPKLLRVLQEQEFERLGGAHTTRGCPAGRGDQPPARADRRGGEFRERPLLPAERLSDHLPPLRERTEDIPLLVRHFVTATRGATGASTPSRRGDGRRSPAIPGRATFANSARHRRAVILSHGAVLQLPPPEEREPSGRRPAIVRTSTRSREHILDVLRETNGVGGPRGAAARLGMRRTLVSKMEKLGIPRRPA